MPGTMDIHQLTRTLHTRNDSKIVMMVADGLGGLPMEAGGPTELEAAATPNLDRLASRGVQGASIPVLPGISPGSGPGHLGLFGYDPLTYQIGRGALEATGIGFTLQPGDVAIRCNFCTLDEAGRITDRRAGRIPTEQSTVLVERLRQVQVPGVEIFALWDVVFADIGGGHGCHLHCQVVGKCLHVLSPRDEVCFAVNLNDGADAATTVDVGLY